MSEKRDLKELLKLIEPLPGGKWDIDELWQGDDYRGPREFEISAKDFEGNTCILGYYKATCWVEDLVPFWEVARGALEEAIQRAMDAEAEKEEWKANCNDSTDALVDCRYENMKLSVQVAALRDGMAKTRGFLEYLRRYYSIAGYDKNAPRMMETMKVLNGLLAAPDPGEKHRQIIDIAIERHSYITDKSKQLIDYMGNGTGAEWAAIIQLAHAYADELAKFDDKLEQAVADLFGEVV